MRRERMHVTVSLEGLGPIGLLEISIRKYGLKETLKALATLMKNHGPIRIGCSEFSPHPAQLAHDFESWIRYWPEHV